MSFYQVRFTFILSKKNLKNNKSIFLGKFLLCFAKLPSKLNGGLEIARNDMYNYHISVQHKQQHICSGSIISVSHILTSASCVVLENGGDIMVLLSNLQILTDTKDKLNSNNTGNIHEISYAFIYEDYNAQHFWINDIGKIIN